MTRLHGKTAPGTRLNSSTKGGEIEVKDPNWVGIQMCLMPITLPENILKNARMSPPKKKKRDHKNKAGNVRPEATIDFSGANC